MIENKVLRIVFAASLAWNVGGEVTSGQQPQILPPGYRVETIPTPVDTAFGVAGLDVAANGDVYAGTRYGDVWRYRAGAWSRFADGLHEVTGLMVNHKTGDVFVMQKPELTQLIDSDGDGVADVYKTISAEWGFSGNYHEFAFGPVQDAEGNFYGTLNLSHGAGPNVKGSVMSIGQKYRGTCFRVTPAGKFSIFAWGMRSPAGLGIDPNTGDLFYTDNQGDWNASSSLQHVVEGRFHGHPASLLYHPDFKDRDLNAIPTEVYDKLRTPPAAWIPHGEIANSPGNPLTDTTQGKFGPFAGQMFCGDQSRSNVFRIVLEKVDGQYQGAVINFIDHLQSGAIRLAFAPDGSMWVGQTSRGWGSAGAAPYGVQRIVYDGRTVPLEIHSVRIAPNGFDIRFTRPVTKASAEVAGHYHVQHWRYQYDPAYGSPKLDLQNVQPTSVTLSDDGQTVQLRLPEVVAGTVYRLTLSNLASPDGATLTNPTAYYTVNRTR
jgi:hypothetical protein